jgi:hypothetical protein
MTGRVSLRRTKGDEAVVAGQEIGRSRLPRPDGQVGRNDKMKKGLAVAGGN